MTLAPTPRADAPAPAPSAGVRALQALLGAFGGVTAGAIVAGLLVPGDFFNLADVRALFPIVLFGASGGYGAFRLRGRAARGALVAIVAASALYWVAAPSGWWASPPPAPGRAAAPG